MKDLFSQPEEAARHGANWVGCKEKSGILPEPVLRCMDLYCRISLSCGEHDV
jgi:hypothetical protein